MKLSRDFWEFTLITFGSGHGCLYSVHTVHKSTSDQTVRNSRVLVAVSAGPFTSFTYALKPWRVTLEAFVRKNRFWEEPQHNSVYSGRSQKMMMNYLLWITILSSFTPGFADPIDFQFQKCCPENQVRICFFLFQYSITILGTKIHLFAILIFSDLRYN